MTKPAIDPSRVSPSRLGKYASCGKAFELSYIDKVPFTVGSAALFGSVLHKAREEWVVDRTQKMVPLVEKAWRSETADEPSITAFIREYQGLAQQAKTLEAEIRAARPEIVAPRRTKDWKESKVAADIAAMIAAWLPRLNDGRYRFTESDPLPALYDESLGVGFRYQERYKHLPPAIESEFAFEFEWHGFTLNGKIDSIELLLDKDTGEFYGYSIEDGKTYRNEPDHAARDARQLAMYDVAVAHYIERGIFANLNPDAPRHPCIDLMRVGKKVYYPPIQEVDRKRLLRELRMYRNAVKASIFLPASKSCQAAFCDVKEACEHHFSNQARPVELNVA